MRLSAPLVLIVCALVTAIVSLFADDSYGRLVSMQKGVEHQVHTNAKLDDQVQALKRQVSGLQNDPRVVEKAARSGLGMARADEVVVIFDRKAANGVNVVSKP